MNTIVVGVDASLTCTGIAVGSSPDTVAVSTVKIKPIPGGIRNKFIRLKMIVNWVEKSLVGVTEPTIFIEGYGFASISAVKQAELGGLLRQSLLSMLGDNGNLVEVPPTSLKMFVAEHGHADKALMATWARKRWGVEFRTDDEVDAYGMWRYGRAYLGIDTDLSIIQQTSVDKVKNPKPKVRKKKKAENPE